jgi:hypothetical protein
VTRTPMEMSAYRTYAVRATAKQTAMMFREAIAGTPSLWDRPCQLSDAQFNEILDRVIAAHLAILAGQCGESTFLPLPKGPVAPA